MLLLDVKAIDVVQVAVPRLRHYGQAAVENVREPGPAPLDHRIAHRSHAVRIGDGDRIRHNAVILYPRRASHFSVSVEAEPAGKNRRQIAFAPRKYRGHPGTDRSNAYPQGTAAFDQCRVSHG